MGFKKAPVEKATQGRRYAPTFTQRAFHADHEARVKGLRGPIGSAKSTASVWAVYFSAMEQRVSRRSKYRESRWVIVRNSLQQLRDTSLKTWFEWFEDGKVGTYVKSESAFYIEHGDIRCEVLFRPLDTPDDVQRVLSLELTGAFLNEARELPYSIVSGVDGRIGRFPTKDPLDLQEQVQAWVRDVGGSVEEFARRARIEPERFGLAMDGKGLGDGDPARMEEGIVGAMNRDGMRIHGNPLRTWDLWGARYPHMVMDTNPPDEDHWWFEVFETGRIPGSSDELSEAEMAQIRRKYKQYVFPPGLIRDTEKGVWVTNPDAENLENLPSNYYTDAAIGKPRDWVKVYCLGRYGVVFDGKLVYTDYDDDRHCGEFDVDPTLPTYAGWDYSVSGQALVLAQLSPRGQLRVFDEYYSDSSGLEQFVSEIKPDLMSKWGKLKWDRSFGDPAGNARQTNTERTALDLLNDVYPDQKLGLPFMTEPSWTNAWGTRRGAVEHFLYRLVSGRPTFLLHPRCDRLRKGFLGRYHLRKLQTLHGGFKEEPDKNAYSHCQDALGYIATGILRDSTQEDAEERRVVARAGSKWSGY